MKRLHDLKPPSPERAYLWYTAVQRRRGAHHLLVVPILELDVNRMAPPRYGGNTDAWRATLIRTNQNLVIPQSVMPEMAVQWCNRHQDARHWEWTGDSWRNQGEARPRGYCDRCWAGAHLPGQAAILQAFTNVQRAYNLATNATQNGVQYWKDITSRRFYVR